MTITIEISQDIEMQIRAHAVRGNADAVRHLLIEALGPTLGAMISHHTSAPLSDSTFEVLAEQLADDFMACVGPDCPSLSDYAVSRAGLYEDHV